MRTLDAWHGEKDQWWGCGATMDSDTGASSDSDSESEIDPWRHSEEVLSLTVIY